MYLPILNWEHKILTHGCLTVSLLKLNLMFASFEQRVTTFDAHSCQLLRTIEHDVYQLWTKSTNLWHTHAHKNYLTVNLLVQQNVYFPALDKEYQPLKQLFDCHRFSTIGYDVCHLWTKSNNLWHTAVWLLTTMWDSVLLFKQHKCCMLKVNSGEMKTMNFGTDHWI